VSILQKSSRFGFLFVALFVCRLTLAADRPIAAFPCDTAEAAPPKNFGKVVRGDGTFAGIYRGGQPTTCGEIRYLKDLGIRTIVKLNESGTELDRAEIAAAQAAGMQIESFRINPFSIGRKRSCASVGRILDILTDDKSGPVYVHCSVGRDRTGYIVGTFEEVVLHKQVTAVLDELAFFGYHGYPTLLFRQIMRELRSGNPVCTADRAFR